MDQTALLGLPYIMAAQAQKHVTHNEAIRALDALVHLSVVDRDLNTPPGAPTQGDRYVVAANASGVWNGHDNEIAAYQDGAWVFFNPNEGWIAWVSDENAAIVWDGTSWQAFGGGGGGGGGGITSVNPISLVGVNATADTTNRLSVSSPAVLFNHAGSDHQLKINKAGNSDTASLLYQKGFSGRAEMGLTGDNDFHIKVSSNGSSWNEALAINGSSGEVSLPNTAPAKIGGDYGGSQSIPNGAATNLTDISVTTNTLGDSTYSSGAITIGTNDAGLWYFDFQTNIPGASALKGAYILKNSTQHTVAQFANTSGSEVLKGVGVMQLAANDVVKFQIYQATGSSQKPGATTRFFGYRIGN